MIRSVARSALWAAPVVLASALASEAAPFHPQKDSAENDTWLFVIYFMIDFAWYLWPMIAVWLALRHRTFAELDIFVSDRNPQRARFFQVLGVWCTSISGAAICVIGALGAVSMQALWAEATNTGKHPVPWNVSMAGVVLVPLAVSLFFFTTTVTMNWFFIIFTFLAMEAAIGVACIAAYVVADKVVVGVVLLTIYWFLVTVASILAMVAAYYNDKYKSGVIGPAIGVAGDLMFVVTQDKATGDAYIRFHEWVLERIEKKRAAGGKNPPRVTSADGQSVIPIF